MSVKVIFEGIDKLTPSLRHVERDLGRVSKRVKTLSELTAASTNLFARNVNALANVSKALLEGGKAAVSFVKDSSDVISTIAEVTTAITGLMTAKKVGVFDFDKLLEDVSDISEKLPEGNEKFKDVLQQNMDDLRATRESVRETARARAEAAVASRRAATIEEQSAERVVRAAKEVGDATKQLSSGELSEEAAKAGYRAAVVAGREAKRAGETVTETVKEIDSAIKDLHGYTAKELEELQKDFTGFDIGNFFIKFDQGIGTTIAKVSNFIRTVKLIPDLLKSSFGKALREILPNQIDDGLIKIEDGFRRVAGAGERAAQKVSGAVKAETDKAAASAKETASAVGEVVEKTEDTAKAAKIASTALVLFSGAVDKGVISSSSAIVPVVTQLARIPGIIAKIGSALGTTLAAMIGITVPQLGLIVVALVAMVEQWVRFYKEAKAIFAFFKKLRDDLKKLAATIRDLTIKAVKLLAKVLVKTLVVALRLTIKAGIGFVNFVKKIPERIGKAVAFVDHFTTSLLNLNKMFGAVAGKVEEFVAGAAELEGVAASFEVIAGATAGETLTELKAKSAGMAEAVDLMKAFSSASLLVGPIFAESLGTALPYLTKLSLATGESIDYLTDSYVRGIGRLSPKILDNLKIQVSQAEIAEHAAEMFDKETDALSTLEKQTAATDLVLTKLEVRTRGLADPTGSLTQLMAKFNITMAENAKLLASHFIPAAKSFFTLMNNIADTTRKNISEGGKWYNSIRYVSAALTVLSDILKDFVRNLESSVDDSPFDNLGQKFVDLIADGFEWGAGLVSNFAQGMISAGGTALIGAIKWISNILSYWMEPHSPPKFLSDIADWGAGTFTEFLRGFGNADFDVLTAVQSPLKSALSLLASTGDLDITNIGDIYTDLSASMAAAIESFKETGDISADTLVKLAAVGGGFGQELEELFKRQLAVAAATEDVVDAENRLSNARKAEESSSKALTKGAREYNKLLREGADAATLAAKLAELRGEYSTLVNAREAAEIAENDLGTAKEQAKEANRLAGLQAKLLQQLLDIASAREAAAKAAEAEADAGEEFDPGDPYTSTIPSIDSAFEALKERIRTKFNELWAELKLDWEESGVGSLIADLKTTWEESNLKQWWDEFVLDIGEEGLKEALGNLWTKLVPVITSWLAAEDKKQVWYDAWLAFIGVDGEETNWGDVLTILWRGALDMVWEAIKKGWGRVMFKFGRLIGLSVSGQKEYVDLEGTKIGDSFASGFTRGILMGLKSYTESVKSGFVKIFKAIKRRINELLGIGGYGGSKVYEDLGTTMGSSVIVGIQGTQVNLENAAESLVTQGVSKMEQSLRIYGDTSWKTFDVGKAMGKGLKDGLDSESGGIKYVLNNIISHIENAVNFMIDGINFAIRGLRSLPGAGWLNEIGDVHLPRLNKGGVITGKEQLALLHGPEAVIPLNDKRAMDMLRDSMGGSSSDSKIEIHQHFGKDSVRSIRDIRNIADETARVMRLQGVRSAL